MKKLIFLYIANFTRLIRKSQLFLHKISAQYSPFMFVQYSQIALFSLFPVFSFESANVVKDILIK